MGLACAHDQLSIQRPQVNILNSTQQRSLSAYNDTLHAAWLH